jgi:molybdate transport system substrate-binding protein
MPTSKAAVRSLGRLLLGLLAGLGAGCGEKAATEAVSVSAAVSTREALEQVAADFRQQTGIPVALSFGASSALARQIEQGAVADLFLSADEDWADYLAKNDHVAERRTLLTNRLVVVLPADSSLSVKDLADLAGPGVRRLALAGPEVPAGRYAREALRSAGLWGRLRERVLDGGDVRAALTFVARGEAEAGMVYATDAAGNARVRVALEVPAERHAPIRYPLVLLRREPIKPGARALYNYLASPEAAAVFRRVGFGVAVRE